jgi:hypothetical protein
LAKKAQELGVKPQDSFSKALAAGEPLPKTLPEPVGLENLPKKEPAPEKPAEPPEKPAEPPEEPKAAEPPAEPEAPPEAPAEPAKPVKISPSEVEKAAAAGDFDALEKNAGKMGIKAREAMKTAALKAHDDGDYEKAAKLAGILSTAFEKTKGKTHAFTKAWADKAQEFAKKAVEVEPGAEPEKPAEKPKPGEPLSDKNVTDALDSGDLSVVEASAKEITKEQIGTLKQAWAGADDDGDYKKTAEVADAVSAVYAAQGEHEAASTWKSFAHDAKAKAGIPYEMSPSEAKSAADGAMLGDEASMKLLKTNAKKLGAARKFVKAQMEWAVEKEDWSKAAELASIVSQSYEGHGIPSMVESMAQAAESYKKKAEAKAESEGKLSDSDVYSALAKQDYDKLVASAGKLTKDQLAGVIGEAAGLEQLASSKKSADSYEDAAKIASALSEYYKAVGSEGNASAWDTKAQELGAKAEAAKPHPMDDSEIKDAVKNGDYKKLVNNATELGQFQIDLIGEQWSKAVAAGESDKAQDIANAMSAIRKATGDEKGAAEWADAANKVTPGLTQGEFDAALAYADAKTLEANAEAFGPDEKFKIKQAGNKFMDEGDYEQAAALQSALATILKAQGDDAPAAAIEKLAKETQQKAEQQAAFETAISEGDADLVLTNAENMSATVRAYVNTAYYEAQEAGDWEKAAKYAEAMSKSYKKDGNEAWGFWDTEAKYNADKIKEKKPAEDPVPQSFDDDGNMEIGAITAALNSDNIGFLVDNAAAITMPGLSDVTSAASKASDAGDWSKAAKLAGILVTSLKAKGKTQAADNWAKTQEMYAKKAGEEAPAEVAEPSGGFLTSTGVMKAKAVGDALNKGNTDFLLANADKLGPAGLADIQAAINAAEEDGEWSFASKLANVLIEYFSSKGDNLVAAAWKASQDDYAKKSGGAVPDSDVVAKLSKQYSEAFLSSDWIQTANVAKKIAQSLKEQGDEKGAKAWEESANAASSNAVMLDMGLTPPESPSDKELDAMVEAGTIGAFGDMAGKLKDFQAAKLEAAFQKAVANEDHKKAWNLAEMLAKYHDAKGNDATAEEWKKSAEYHKGLAEKDPESAKPKEAEPVSLEEMEAKGLLVLPWNAKPAKGKKAPSPSSASSQQAIMGLAADEFLHPSSKEVCKVVGLDENEYVDPNDGVVYDKKTKKPVKAKGKFNMVATGKAIEDAGDGSPAPGPTTSQPMPDKLPPVSPSTPIDMTPDTPSKDAAKAIPLPAGIPKVSDLTLVGSANHLGGAGDKRIYTDKAGKQWLFKSAYAKGGGAAKPYAAVAQQTWAEVARKVTPEHLIIGTVEVDGKIGTLQPLVELDGNQADLGNVSPKDLSDEDRKILIQEHVLDWLGSQHDSHGANFVRRASDGKIFSTDKEQGYRFFGQDKLSVDYAPNSDLYGEKPPYYNSMWKGWVNGDYDMDPMDAKTTIESIESMTTKEYIATLRPYAETMWPNKPEKQLDFLKAARKRKLDLRKDFERFFTGLYRKKTGEDGNFTFDAGWSGEEQKPEGPKVVKHSVSARDYLAKFAADNSAKMKIEPYYSDWDAKKVDPSKTTIKISKSDTNGAEKVKKYLATFGMDLPEQEMIEGPYYNMFFVDTAQLDAGKVTYEEIVKPPEVVAGIKSTTNTPRYFPDDYEYPIAEANHEDLKNLQNTPTGMRGKRYEADGGAVEGSILRVRRYKDAEGDYYGFQFKLRPKQWKAIRDAGGGEPVTKHFYESTYDSKKDCYVETDKHIDLMSAHKGVRRFRVGDSECDLITSTQSGSKASDPYGYVGGVWVKARPKPGQSPYDALAEMLNTMKPGLADEVLRSATPKEREVWKLSQLLWAHAPQVADKTSKGSPSVAKLKSLLAEAGVSEEDIANTELKEVLPGYSTHVQKGRWKKLRDKGMKFVFHGANVASAVSVVQRGALGINERNAAGLKKVGVSPNHDINTGSSDGVLGYVAHTSTNGHNVSNFPFANKIQYVMDPRVLDRLDPYLHSGDSYGTCTPYSNNRKPGHLWTARKTLEQKIENLDSDGSDHEISFRRGIDPKSILRINADSETNRRQVIKDLRAAGIEEVNGVPVEDFVVVGGSVDNIYRKYVEPMMTEERHA